jgi:adenylylsulfate reductase, subunit A
MPRDANRGIELIQLLRADPQKLAARDRHELLRCWELWHRTWVGEVHMRHLLHRQETRWPGYYYRADFPKLDDTHWRVFVNSRYHADHDTWELFTKPYISLVKCAPPSEGSFFLRAESVRNAPGS